MSQNIPTSDNRSGTSKRTRGDAFTAFERRVVFRVSRGFFFALAVVAVLVFAAGIAVGGRGLAKGTVQEPDYPPPPPLRAPLSYAEVQRTLAQEAARAQQAANSMRLDEPAEGGEERAAPMQNRAPDPLAARFAALQEELKALFPEPTYTWTNQVDRKCTYWARGTCYRWQSTVAKEGIVGIVDKSIAKESKQRKVALLEVLVRVLKEVPEDKRGENIDPIVQVENGAYRAQQQLEAESDRAVAMLRAKHLAEVAANDEKHAEWVRYGGYGLGSGFVLLLVVSLFLAFLAMERHTRALEAFAGSLGRFPADRPISPSFPGGPEPAGIGVPNQPGPQ